MPMFRVFSTHYAPKDSHEALSYIVQAADDGALLDWLDKTVLYGGLSEHEEDEDDPSSISIDEPTTEDRKRAATLGLEMTLSYGDTYSITGPFRSLLLFDRGDYWREVSDLYYGATQWRWEEIPDCDPDVLRIALGDRFVDAS